MDSTRPQGHPDRRNVWVCLDGVSKWEQHRSWLVGSADGPLQHGWMRVSASPLRARGEQEEGGRFPALCLLPSNRGLHHQLPWFSGFQIGLSTPWLSWVFGLQIETVGLLGLHNRTSWFFIINLVLYMFIYMCFLYIYFLLALFLWRALIHQARFLCYLRSLKGSTQSGSLHL